MIFGGGEHWVGGGVKTLSVELESFVIIYLKEFFKLSQVLLTSIAFAALMLKMSNYSGCPLLPALTGLEISSCCVVFSNVV